MLTNDKMITQVLTNMQDLNDQAVQYLEVLCGLDRTNNSGRCGSLNLHDQVTNMDRLLKDMNKGLESAHNVHGVTAPSEWKEGAALEREGI